MYVFTEAGGQCQILLPYFLRHSLSLAWKSLSRLGLLATESLRFICLLPAQRGN